MDRQEQNESRPAPTADVITQKELASQLIFQNAEHPPRTLLLERLQMGARIEPGPLTIVQPYVDLGPFVIPTPDSPRRSEQIRRLIREANFALDNIDRPGSEIEFSRVAREIAIGAWEAVRERRDACVEARNWSGLSMLVRDQIYACELKLMLWVAERCVVFQLGWFGEKAFDLASARADLLLAL